jgi:CTP:phosphocholine cytidylyltransferase-like protein
MFQVDNAVILAAGTSSRFAPLSYEQPKALIEVRGEVLIERQIRQLKEAGVPSVCVVTGYKADQFSYLRRKYGVELIHNPDYLTRNNNGSIYAARDVLRNSYICSADNYFTENPFEREVAGSYYAAVYAEGDTSEWCLTAGPDGIIDSVAVGGRDAWYMLGHVFWDETFSRRFLEILTAEYDAPATAGKLWEDIYAAHLDRLPMSLRKYPPGVIFEFDTLDELRGFDPSYRDDTRSPILRDVAGRLGCRQRDITDIRAWRGSTAEAEGFTFRVGSREYRYSYETRALSAACNTCKEANHL